MKKAALVMLLPAGAKMTDLCAAGNDYTASIQPSWTGPIWGASNYLVFQGLLNYGYEKEAEEPARKTVKFFGRDFQRFGALHEYYQPDNGEPILNKGFQNWDYLVMNMIARLEKRERIEEF